MSSKNFFYLKMGSALAKKSKPTQEKITELPRKRTIPTKESFSKSTNVVTPKKTYNRNPQYMDISMPKPEMSHNPTIGGLNIFNTEENSTSVLETYDCHQFSPLHVKEANVASTFVGQTHRITPDTVCYLQRGQNSATATGSFWFRYGYEGATRYDYAILRGWNDLSHTATLAVPKGIFMYEGKAASQEGKGEWLPGGASQIYIPFDVVHALLPLSEAFLASSERDVDAYIEQCLDVVLFQFQGYNEFLRQEGDKHLEASENNIYFKLKTKVDALLDSNLDLVRKYIQLNQLYAKLNLILPTITTIEAQNKFKAYKTELHTKLQTYYADIALLCEGILEEWDTDELITQESLHPTQWSYFTSLDSRIRQLLHSETVHGTEEPLPAECLNTKFRVHKHRNCTLYVSIIFLRKEEYMDGNKMVHHYYYELNSEWREG